MDAAEFEKQVREELERIGTFEVINLGNKLSHAPPGVSDKIISQLVPMAQGLGMDPKAAANSFNAGICLAFRRAWPELYTKFVASIHEESESIH